jgi:DNA-binding response OmpR family regulator
MHVLVVEDHQDVADVLQMGLEEYGYRVDLARDGKEGEGLLRANDYDVLISDWMLPGQDGPTLVQRIREHGIDLPVLMLTARAEKQDQIDALDAGADDYLAKPFSFEVLLARLRALLRRAGTPGAAADSTTTLNAGPLQIDLLNRRVWLGDYTVELRTKEYDLLTCFAEHPNRVLTRTVIVERVWDSLFTSDDVLNTTLASLRRKLRTASEQSGVDAPAIETLRGVGYRLQVGEVQQATAA